MNVGVTGSRGRLGCQLIPLSPIYHPLEHDVTSRWGFAGHYDAILHLAALTSVPRCEREQSLAWQVNVIGTSHAIEYCLRTGTRLLYMSSTYAAHPVNFYDYTKLLGEQMARHVPSHLIIRSQFKERPYPYEVAPIDAMARALYADEVAAKLHEHISAGRSGRIDILGPKQSLFAFARQSRPDIRPCKRADLPHFIPRDTHPSFRRTRPRRTHRTPSLPSHRPPRVRD